MPLFRAFAVCLIAAVFAPAQRPPQNPRAAALVHITLNSGDPAALAFWKDFVGMSTYSRGSLQGVSALGVLMVFDPKAPTGPSAGSAIDHLGFHVPDLAPYIEKVAKTSFKSFQPVPGGDSLMIDGPDGVRIELTEDNSMYPPLEFAHVHFHTAQPADTEAWYEKYFGARPVEDQPQSLRLGGGTLSFTQAASAAPTSGRAIDRLAFEVKDLKGFCEKLAADGVKMDSPDKGGAVFLTDPWGVRIELTEGPGR